MLSSRRGRCRLVPGDHREDDPIERTVGFLEERRGLSRLERATPRDVGDLSHEASAEVEERLRRLAQREAGSLRLDPVLAAQGLGLRQVLLLPRAPRGVEVAELEVAHTDPALAEPAQRALIEPRVPVLVTDVGAHALPELSGDLVGG